jgi:wobble nucleotide-excising tRNase
MIESIVMNKVAGSFQQETTAKSLKKVNLFYGCNGTGKTQITRFLSRKNNQGFESCYTTPSVKQDSLICVYNTDFVQDHFYEVEDLSGIFLLDKPSIDAQNVIDIANLELESLKKKAADIEVVTTSINQRKTSNKKNITDKAWAQLKVENKARIFSTKEELSSALLDKKLSHKYKKDSTLIELINEYCELKSSNKEKKQSNYKNINYDLEQLETASVFQEIITGSENNFLTEIVEKLNHQSWIVEGIEHLKQSEYCPFCIQQIDDTRRANINSYINSVYNEKLDTLGSIKKHYEDKKIEITNCFNEYLESKDCKEEVSQAVKDLNKIISDNQRNIEKKIKASHVSIDLTSTKEYIDKINQFIANANSCNKEFNAKIDDKDNVLKQLKDAITVKIQAELQYELKEYYKLEQECTENQKQISDNNVKKQTQLTILENNQWKDFDICVDRINKRLESCGFHGFQIEKAESKLNSPPRFKLVRNGKSNNNVFQTLSEGEKTIISFVYFLEKCEEMLAEKRSCIVVIDDPISSVSINLIHEVATSISLLAKKTNNLKLQMFVLTHSWYFFHELCQCLNRYSGMEKPGKEIVEITYHRIKKYNDSSNIESIDTNKIQNSYQEYWEMVNDIANGSNESKSSSRVLAIAMRNIVEYFFTFNNKLNALTNVEEQLIAKYKSNAENIRTFFRFINKNAHSDPVNDYAEADSCEPEKWLKYFEEIFKLSDSEVHYKKYRRTI